MQSDIQLISGERMFISLEVLTSLFDYDSLVVGARSLSLLGSERRTWTVILVDGNSHVDFVERTLEEPIQCNETGVENKWLATRYSFNL